MPRKGYKQTPEHRAKHAAALKGKPRSAAVRANLIECNRTRVWSAESRAKISAARKGKRLSEEHKAKISIKIKGHKTSLETRAKIAAAHRGMKHTQEARAKVAAARRGTKASLETRAKMSAARRGDKHPLWRGGISREPYGWEWSKELREVIRQRDGHRCQLCGRSQTECKRVLSIHHIDYDKQNNDPANLIALCSRCHSQTNIHRDHWAIVFGSKRTEQSILEMVGQTTNKKRGLLKGDETCQQLLWRTCPRQ